MSTVSEPDGLVGSHLTFRYGSEPVLGDVSFRLARREMVALAGPNGSGKTTLLKLLSGALRPVEGTVSLYGNPISGLRPGELARHVAVVSQQVDQQLMFTVESLAAMGRAPYLGLWRSAGDRDRRAVCAALEATGLAHLGNRRFDELSGGEQQRTMLAMALAQETEFLLLDEPTVHLDLHHQHDLLELLRGLHCSRGIAIMAVMHDLNLAALYFDRLVVMQRGSIVADGPPDEVLRSATTLAVFQAPLHVVTHPAAGVPQVLLDGPGIAVRSTPERQRQ